MHHPNYYKVNCICFQNFTVGPICFVGVFFTFRGDDDITDMVRIPDCCKFDDVSTTLQLKFAETLHKLVINQ